MRPLQRKLRNMGSIQFAFLQMFLIGLWSAPWHKDVHRPVPWEQQGPQPSAKRENLENFFRELPSQTLTESRQVDGSGVSVVAARSQEVDDLDQLPWKDYQKYREERSSDDFLWPVESGKLTSGFGMRRGRWHEGIDLKAPLGTSIRAMASGRVVFSGAMRGYGKIVVLYHGGGLSSVYAHNHENLVRVGQRVTQGESIATLGNSGRTRGAHLHFEIREEGKAVNPLKWRFREGLLLSER